MIREVERAELPECVRVIRKSFQTVADELGFTRENAPRFTAFATTEERLGFTGSGEGIAVQAVALIASPMDLEASSPMGCAGCPGRA